MGLIVAPALLLNFLLHGIFAPLMQNTLGTGSPVSQSLFTLLFCVVGLFRLVALYHRWKIESLYVVSLSDQSEEIALPAIYLKKKINLSFALSRAIQGAKSLLLVCLSIGMILGLFLCVREDVNNRLGKNFHKGVFSFSVYAAKLREKDVATFGDFRLTRRSVGFSRE